MGLLEREIGCIYWQGERLEGNQEAGSPGQEHRMGFDHRHLYRGSEEELRCEEVKA